MVLESEINRCSGCLWEVFLRDSWDMGFAVFLVGIVVVLVYECCWSRGCYPTKEDLEMEASLRRAR